MGKSAQQGRFSLTTAEVIQGEKNGGAAKVSGKPLCSERKRVRNPIKQDLILQPFFPSRLPPSLCTVSSAIFTGASFEH